MLISTAACDPKRPRILNKSSIAFKSMDIDRENLTVSALCSALARMFSGEISPRHLLDLKAELLARLRDLPEARPTARMLNRR